MKNKWKILLAVFIVAFLGFLILFALFFNALFELNLISERLLKSGTCIATLIVSIFCEIVAIILLKSDKKTKFGNWISNNIAKIMLAYTLLTVFLASIHPDVVMDFSDIKEIISLCWTIFGISIAIYLIWNVVTMDYLEEMKPIKPKSDLPIKISVYIQEKSFFYSNAIWFFSNVNLLLINLYALIIASVLGYVIVREATILTQSITILTLFLCTNSIVSLFLDILKPYNKKKKAMLQETEVTKDDVELQNLIEEETKSMLKTVETVKSMNTVSDDIKTIVIAGLIESYKGKFGDISEQGTDAKK